MGALCPECGCASRDPEVCERCNTDLGSATGPAIVHPGPTLADVPADLLTAQAARLTRPEAAVRAKIGGQHWRCHWIPDPLWPTWQSRVQHRLGQHVAALPPGQLLPGDGGVWVLVQAAESRWTPWLNWPGMDRLDALEQLAGFAEQLAQALEQLHAAGFVWLDFDPLALEEVEGRVRFTNLDLALDPIGTLSPEAACLPGFLPPEVGRGLADQVGPRTNVFHLALLAYYAIGRFLPHGFFGKGLASFEYEIPPVRIFEPGLPIGVAPAIDRGLAIDPDERPPTPLAWCALFRLVLERTRLRANTTGEIAWETGFHTRVGRSKAALGRANEDTGFVRSFSDPDRTAVVIADGVSCCEVGSGEMASRIVSQHLEAALTPALASQDFFARATAACAQAGREMLQWAVEHGDRDRLAAGADLMGTTALVAWLEGRTLQVANVGDSRVYLLHDAGIEQVTVDGDLGNALLAAGVPPEEIWELGGAAYSLYSYVGGSARDGNGEPDIGEHAEPERSRFPLLPGDTVILCSDGLVEEGAFLEPGDVLRLVREHSGLSAQALAEKLADAADARQALPSPAEPNGRGDNITCSVLRVFERDATAGQPAAPARAALAGAAGWRADDAPAPGD